MQLIDAHISILRDVIARIGDESVSRETLETFLSEMAFVSVNGFATDEISNDQFRNLKARILCND